jgi:hypothetical protein
MLDLAMVLAQPAFAGAVGWMFGRVSGIGRGQTLALKVLDVRSRRLGLAWLRGRDLSPSEAQAAAECLQAATPEADGF